MVAPFSCLVTYVDELLPAFCERYNLTARERVIVEQVLQGKDNQGS